MSPDGVWGDCCAADEWRALGASRAAVSVTASCCQCVCTACKQRQLPLPSLTDRHFISCVSSLSVMKPLD